MQLNPHNREMTQLPSLLKYMAPPHPDDVVLHLSNKLSSMSILVDEDEETRIAPPSDDDWHALNSRLRMYMLLFPRLLGLCEHFAS